MCPESLRGCTEFVVAENLFVREGRDERTLRAAATDLVQFVGQRTTGTSPAEAVVTFLKS